MNELDNCDDDDKAQADEEVAISDILLQYKSKSKVK